MATSGRGTGIVGYNVQAVVDAKHHLIVVHDVVKSTPPTTAECRFALPGPV